ncbi:MAG: PKD domain-containing protein, partial [Deltaproteobacteria bacterium]|nr:PKD domain-containing protein [Deltaproteobacteria bacterium]
MYRFYRRKSYFMIVFLFSLIITATAAKAADRIAMLENSTTQRAPILSLFDPDDQFTRRSGPGLPSNYIQFGNIVDAAGAEINGTEGEELILLGMSASGYSTLSVLEQSADSVQPDFKVTAGVIFLGRYFKFITVGNFDGDSGQEFAVVSSNPYGSNGLIIYDLPATRMSTLPRWLARDPDIGTKIVALTSADMNGDGADELIITRKNTDGTFSVEVYNPPKTSFGDMGEPLSSFAEMAKDIIPNGVTAGEFDGDPELELGLIYILPGAGLQLDIFDAPRRLGDNAGKPLASVSIGNGDIIALTALNSTDSEDSEQTPNEPPQAVIEEVPQQDVASLDISLDGSQSLDPDGSIVSYHWDFGDGSSADGPSVEYTYQTAGTYRVTLTVTDDEGAQDSTTTTIEVFQPEDRNNPPQAVIQVSPATGTAPLPVIFDAYRSRDPDGYIRTYNWKLDDRFLTNYRGFYYVFRTPGIYRVTLT